jgi:Zn-dependent protease
MASAVLACPVCRRLVFAEELKQLSAEAERSAREGDTRAALATWRRVLELLPPETNQYRAVGRRIDELGRQGSGDAGTGEARADGGAETAGPSSRRWVQRAAPLAGLGLLLTKFKFVLVFLATQAKLLLFGLTKAGTLVSMLLSLGVYWNAYGWKFALGLIASIYVHEMGHVAALRRLGIRASAPMFIPGLGAVVRMKQYPVTPREDAEVGLAGPLWGLGAVLVAAAGYWATGAGSLGAIARGAAWINLFNLLPVWQLDGARGFHALGRWQRWLVAVVAAGLFLVTHEGLLILIAIVAMVRALGAAPAVSCRRTLGLFLVLLGGLALLCRVLERAI